MHPGRVLLPLFITQCNLTLETPSWANSSLVLFTSPPGTRNALPDLRLWLSLATDDLHAFGLQAVISNCCPPGVKCKIPSMALYAENGTVTNLWPSPQAAYDRLGGQGLFQKVHELMENEEGILRADFSEFQAHYISAFLERDKFLIGIFPPKEIPDRVREFKKWRKWREGLFPNEKMGYFYLANNQKGDFIRLLFGLKPPPSSKKFKRYYYIDKKKGVKLEFEELANITGI